MTNKMTFSAWIDRVKAETGFLTGDEQTNAEEAFRADRSPKEFAVQVEQRREWERDKATGNLWPR